MQRFITIPINADNGPSTASGMAIVRNGLALHKTITCYYPRGIGYAIEGCTLSGYSWRVTHLSSGRATNPRPIERTDVAREYFRRVIKLADWERATMAEIRALLPQIKAINLDYDLH